MSSVDVEYGFYLFPGDVSGSRPGEFLCAIIAPGTAALLKIALF